MSKFAVVILTRTVPNLVACVMAVRQKEPDLPAERIVIVDDDETGAVGKYCAVHGLTRIQGEKPFIFSRNANHGLAVAFAWAEVAILLNDDALLMTPRGFTEMAKLLDLDPFLGLVSPATNNVGNVNQHFRGWHTIRPEQRMLCFVCVAMPRSTFESVGPLDEQYCLDYGCEDGDYSYRVRKAGLRLGIWDGVEVDHGTLRSTYRGAGPVSFQQNMKVFERKHGIAYMSA